MKFIFEDVGRVFLCRPGTSLLTRIIRHWVPEAFVERGAVVEIDSVKIASEFFEMRRHNSICYVLKLLSGKRSSCEKRPLEIVDSTVEVTAIDQHRCCLHCLSLGHKKAQDCWTGLKISCERC
ncbi:hypothetical protein D3C76_1360200 [compost metagenome]